MEIWKPIKGYEGLYSVSNLSRVRSEPKEVGHSTCGIKGTHIYPGKILKPFINTKANYYRLCFIKDNKREYLLLHRLIAQAFIPNPENKKCVNHIDGDKHNNRLDNLEWATHKENTAHAINHGLRSSWHGDSNPRSRYYERDAWREAV